MNPFGDHSFRENEPGLSKNSERRGQNEVKGLSDPRKNFSLSSVFQMKAQGKMPRRGEDSPVGISKDQFTKNPVNSILTETDKTVFKKPQFCWPGFCFIINVQERLRCKHEE